jgi:hypothetical protein
MILSHQKPFGLTYSAVGHSVQEMKKMLRRDQELRALCAKHIYGAQLI